MENNTSSMSTENTVYSFMWEIENYSYCGQDFEDNLVSPEFVPQGLQGTSWAICLYTNNIYAGSGSHICVKRSEHDAGPENLIVNVEMSFMKVDRSTLGSKECEHAFRKGGECEFGGFLDMSQLYKQRNTNFLPRDTLVVCCRMWQGERNAHKAWQCTALTNISVEKVSINHTVENFSSLRRGEKKILQIPPHSKSGCVFSSELYVDDTPQEGIWVSINPSLDPSLDNYERVVKQEKYSLIDAFGNIRELGEFDLRFCGTTPKEIKLRQSLSRPFILSMKEVYLPNDTLTLLCECTFSTDEDHTTIVETLHNIPLAAGYIPQNKIAECWSAGKLSTCPSTLNNINTLHSDRIISDVVLKTAAKSFSAHKSVLCAQSPVFRDMLTRDMGEANTIMIDDIEAQTVNRLLIFLYSDNIGELEQESALNLYHAADKYAIAKLKVLCSSFLIANLSTSNASRVLLLANNHNDAELKKLVETFILEHTEEVFFSDEWSELSVTNPHLVIQIMQQEFKKKKINK